MYGSERLTIWREKLYTLETSQVDAYMAGIQPGDGIRTFNSIVNSRLSEAGMFPQVMQLSSKSAIYWHPLHVSRGSVPLDHGVENIRRNFLNEVATLNSALSEAGVDSIDTIPEDLMYARLLVLGVFCSHTLQRASEIETDSDFADTIGYGAGLATLYGHRLERVTELLALNEQTIEDAEALLSAAIFLMQFGGNPSAYEIRRNQNVANQLLASLAGGSFTYDDLQFTNKQILDGLAIGGILRDFEHWGGNRKNPPHPNDIPNRFLAWQNNVLSLLEFSRPGDIEMDIARKAADYNEIHPWREANGRSMTVEINKLRAMAGLDPTYIPLSEETDYIFALGNPASEDDTAQLAEFFREHELPRAVFIPLMKHIIETGSEVTLSP